MKCSFKVIYCYSKVPSPLFGKFKTLPLFGLFVCSRTPSSCIGAEGPRWWGWWRIWWQIKHLEVFIGTSCITNTLFPSTCLTIRFSITFFPTTHCIFNWSQGQIHCNSQYQEKPGQVLPQIHRQRLRVIYMVWLTRYVDKIIFKNINITIFIRRDKKSTIENDNLVSMVAIIP